MRRTFYLFVICIVSFLCRQASAQEKGIILGGGSGYLSYKLAQDSHGQAALDAGGSGNAIYQYNLFAGYKYRIENVGSRFFYDLDTYLGFKKSSYKFSSDISYIEKDVMNNTIHAWSRGDGIKGSMEYFYLSFNASINYRILDNFYAGAGIEPTLYQSSGAPITKFDVPLSAKAGYDFGRFELALASKFGMMNILKSSEFHSGRFTDFQVSVFVPF
jgi:hypothetical protein